MPYWIVPMCDNNSPSASQYTIIPVFVLVDSLQDPIQIILHYDSHQLVLMESDHHHHYHTNPQLNDSNYPVVIVHVLSVVVLIVVFEIIPNIDERHGTIIGTLVVAINAMNILIKQSHHTIYSVNSYSVHSNISIKNHFYYYSM